MKEFINRNKGKILLIFCSFLSGVIGVSASIIIFSSEEVSYDNSKSGMSSSNVQDAIDELYGVARLSDRIDELEKIIESKIDFDDAYPIGSIYISISSKSPKELFGGTWEPYAEGRTLVGVGNGTDSNSTTKTFSANSSGGEYNHTLTINEMPSHGNHLYSNPVTLTGYGNANGKYLNISTMTTVSSNTYPRGWNIVSNNEMYPSGVSLGGGSAHNNLQPYITVYMWKRTA